MDKRKTKDKITEEELGNFLYTFFCPTQSRRFRKRSKPKEVKK